MHAAENFHQGGFARAILAAQRDDLAAPDLQADVVQRNHAGKSFGDPAHFEERRHGGEAGNVLSFVGCKVFALKEKRWRRRGIATFFETDGLKELDVEDHDKGDDNQA
jgi:hypothetical protein